MGVPGEVKMVSKYDVVSEGRSVALAFVSPHPNWVGYLAASVLPIKYSGEWDKNTREVEFCKLETDMFPNDTPEIAAVNRLLVGAGIDPSRCVVARVPLASGLNWAIASRA